jgi:nitroreductase
MNLKEIAKRTRSYRRFHQEHKINADTLTDVVDNVRYSASAANLQPLKFILLTDAKMSASLFQNLRWAAYLKNWDGPEEGERPSAYIIMLGDRNLSRYLDMDCGIALQTILLSLTEKGLGACAHAAFNKEAVRELFKVPEQLEIPLIIAIGKPKEEVVIDDISGGDVKYWRDEAGKHHVPKKTLKEMIFNTY